MRLLYHACLTVFLSCCIYLSIPLRWSVVNNQSFSQFPYVYFTRRVLFICLWNPQRSQSWDIRCICGLFTLKRANTLQIENTKPTSREKIQHGFWSGLVRGEGGALRHQTPPTMELQPMATGLEESLCVWERGKRLSVCACVCRERSISLLLLQSVSILRSETLFLFSLSFTLLFIMLSSFSLSLFMCCWFFSVSDSVFASTCMCVCACVHKACLQGFIWFIWSMLYLFKSPVHDIVISAMSGQLTERIVFTAWTFLSYGIILMVFLIFWRIVCSAVSFHLSGFVRDDCVSRCGIVLGFLLYPLSELCCTLRIFNLLPSLFSASFC